MRYFFEFAQYYILWYNHKMLISDFDYDLPSDKIAKNPPKTRGRTKLLALDRTTGDISDRKYEDIIDFLQPGDVLVLNNTKVMKARLIAQTKTGAERELVILEKHENPKASKVIYRGRLKAGDNLTIGKHAIKITEILGGGIALVESDVDLLDLADRYGAPPLPPYLKRKATKQDIERYQTVFAKHLGSAAAPTASLNMTPELLDRLKQKGVIIKYLTLHVGLGTFLPIRADKVEDHDIHSEYFEIPVGTIEAIEHAKAHGKKIIAVGTTVARTLEYYAQAPRSITPRGFSGEANIFIYPGYEFRLVDILITNFHAPRSTVLMLAAAAAGWDHLKTAYEHAKNHDYRFLSYGDSMIIL